MKLIPAGYTLTGRVTDGGFMKKRFTVFLVAGLILVIMALSGWADVIETNVWADFKGNVTFNGQPAPVGSIVDAFDPGDLHVGQYIVGISGAANDSAGIYGFLHVYGDDNLTDGLHTGALNGDSITFKVNGIDATPTVTSGSLLWAASSQNDISLAASATIAFTVIEIPTAKAGIPGDTVSFRIGIRNDGTAQDLYGVTSLDDPNPSPGWYTIDQDSVSYALPGATTYVYFDAVIPVFGGGGDTAFTIPYTVYSHLDTSVKFESTVGLYKSNTDAGGYAHDMLPDRFELFQNYPNPFNPTTTISFTIPIKSEVRLEIINILGQILDVREMGLMPSGTHEMEYDATRLSSGVYFYRISTDNGAVCRKMVLLK